MSERVGFKRNIGLFMAVMIGIGAMMGPGIFALPGELAKLVGPLGPARRAAQRQQVPVLQRAAAPAP